MAQVIAEPHTGLEVSSSISPAMPDTRFVNLTVQGIDKAAGVRAIADAYGIDLANVMFVGDAPNDLAALRIVGHPVAMGNAERVVKDVALHQVGDVDEGGLADALALAAAQ